MQAGSIRHTVTFSLKHPGGSAPAQKFLEDATRILSAIPGVGRFECLRQVSSKASYEYGLSMEFRDQAAYDAYSAHPDHTRFVEERWIPEVSEFQELDYVVVTS